MKAALIHRFKQAYSRRRIDGVIWKVPEPVPPTRYGYKYLLVYVVGGVRVVGYDNERGKGDTGIAVVAKRLTGSSMCRPYSGISSRRWSKSNEQTAYRGSAGICGA